MLSDVKHPTAADTSARRRDELAGRRARKPAEALPDLDQHHHRRRNLLLRWDSRLTVRSLKSDDHGHIHADGHAVPDRARRDSIADPYAASVADAVQHADLHAHVDPDGHADAKPDEYRNTDTDGHAGLSDADGNWYGGADSDANADIDLHAHTDTGDHRHFHANADRHGDAHADRDAYADRDAHADRGAHAIAQEHVAAF
jgi:hypothetical protein